MTAGGLTARRARVFVNYFRVRIDPARSETTDRVFEFVFTDRGDHSVALHLRRGVVEFIPVRAAYYREPDSVLKLDSETWAALYLSSIWLEDAIASGRVELARGDRKATIDAFALFDRFQPAQNFTIPPLED